MAVTGDRTLVPTKVSFEPNTIRPPGGLNAAAPIDAGVKSATVQTTSFVMPAPKDMVQVQPQPATTPPVIKVLDYTVNAYQRMYDAIDVSRFDAAKLEESIRRA